MNDSPFPAEEPRLPPEINLKMALDYLYARATDLGFEQTAHLISVAAILVEEEAQAMRKDQQDTERGEP